MGALQRIAGGSLAWVHVLFQNILVGVHTIHLGYIALIWPSLGWRVYDYLLLTFAFSHGVNGLRQVLNDYISHDTTRRKSTWALIAFWLALSLMGAAASIGRVRTP